MDFEKKVMNYTKKCRKQLTIHGKHDGYLYFTIVHLGGYPCGYVVILPNQRGYHFKDNYENSTLDCHGGITFDEFRNVSVNKHRVRVIGFDCAHSNDFNYENYLTQKANPKLFPPEWFKNMYFHHWTASELRHQCYLIINQLVTGKVKSLMF